DEVSSCPSSKRHASAERPRFAEIRGPFVGGLKCAKMGEDPSMARRKRREPGPARQAEAVRATTAGSEHAEATRATHALADSERLYRALFEGMASAVTIRALEDQRFIECNPAALKLFRAESVEQ